MCLRAHLNACRFFSIAFKLFFVFVIETCDFSCIFPYMIRIFFLYRCMQLVMLLQSELATGLICFILISAFNEIQLLINFTLVFDLLVIFFEALLKLDVIAIDLIDNVVV